MRMTYAGAGAPPPLEVGEAMIVGMTLSANHRLPQVQRTWATHPNGFIRVGAVLLALIVGCHKSAPTPPSEESPAITEAPPPRIPLPDDPDAADRWLFVEKAKDDAPGGWATAAFDRQKNKLDVRTRDVRQFAIDMERIAIDWQRLVVIGIDGKNSELRKRDVSLLHFRLDDHGQWVVMEPVP